MITYKEILVTLASLVVSRDRAGFVVKISIRKESLWSQELRSLQIEISNRSEYSSRNFHIHMSHPDKTRCA